jgi:hypothetical protein
MARKGSGDRILLITLSDFFLVLMLIFFVLFLSVSERLNRFVASARATATPTPAALPTIISTPKGSGPLFCKCDNNSCAPDSEGRGTVIATIELGDEGLRIAKIHSASFMFPAKTSDRNFYSPSGFRALLNQPFKSNGFGCKFRAKKVEKFDSNRSYKEIRVIENAFNEFFYQ